MSVREQRERDKAAKEVHIYCVCVCVQSDWESILMRTEITNALFDGLGCSQTWQRLGHLFALSLLALLQGSSWSHKTLKTLSFPLLVKFISNILFSFVINYLKLKLKIFIRFFNLHSVSTARPATSGSKYCVHYVYSLCMPILYCLFRMCKPGQFTVYIV